MHNSPFDHIIPSQFIFSKYSKLINAKKKGKRKLQCHSSVQSNEIDLEEINEKNYQSLLKPVDGS